jgi:hypothetical protein
VGEALAAIKVGNRPGRGGTSRGPGAAKLNFDNETKEEGLKFKEETLPEGAITSLKSRVIGVSRGAPEKEPKVGDAGSGALGDAKAGGGSANTQVVLPRHRGAVERYFDRPAEPKK